jgi:hypothetical protein
MAGEVARSHQGQPAAGPEPLAGQQTASNQTVTERGTHHRFLIAMHSPDGVFETGLLGCLLEKKAANLARGNEQDTFSGVRCKSRDTSRLVRIVSLRIPREQDRERRLVVAERKVFFDESCIRMDGRRDVDLDGDRRTGGSSTGRRD